MAVKVTAKFLETGRYLTVILEHLSVVESQ